MAFISFFTAALSAATGMGGGIVFLIGLNIYLPLDKVIPIHGLIQFKNNLLRVWALRSHLIKDICLYYSIGCLIGVLIVSLFISSISSKLIPYCIILLLVFYSLFKPKKLPELKLNNFGFFILGLATGIIGILVGAVDPLLSPFFLRNDFTKHQIIANKSFFQTMIHLAKFPVFLYLGFNYLDHWFLILILLFSAFLGTLTGLKILNHINQRIFIFIFKLLLLAVSLKITYNIYEILS